MGRARTNILFVLFLFLGCFSAKGQFWKKDESINRTLKYGSYQSILDFYGDMDPNEIAMQFKILGQASLEYGNYDKAASFYEKSMLMDKKHIQEKDVSDYYYALLKSHKEEEVLNDSIGMSFARSSKLIRQLVRNAESRDFYKTLSLSEIQTQKMEIEGLLPRYGLSFNDYYIYFAYFKGDPSEKELFENDLFSFRVVERSRLGRARFLPTGTIGAEGPEICKFKDRRRVVTLSKSQKDEADFYTIVPENGEPEQIGIKGGDFPPFPYNSQEYACAMPFYDENTNRLYFSSTMRGGMGGWDIYYLTYNGTRWNNLVNLGNIVNSPYDEFFPVISDSLLCFSSDGWEGCGGFDNYVFNEKDDTRINLFFANGPGDDYSFQVVDKEKFQGIGIKDKEPICYTAEGSFRSVLDSVYLIVTGESKNEFTQVAPEFGGILSSILTSLGENRMPLSNSGQMSSEGKAENRTIKKRTSVPEQPSYREEAPVRNVPATASYGQRLSIKDLPVNESVDVEKPAKKEIVSEPSYEQKNQKEVAFQPLPRTRSEAKTTCSDLLVTATGAKSKQLGTVYFDTDSPVIKSDYYSYLDNMVKQIINDGVQNIVVWGHADRSGSGRYNDSLSFMRASGVVDYMKSSLPESDDRRFYTVAAGEEYAKGTLASEENDRKVVVREGLRQLPYSVIYTYKALPDQSLKDVAEMFNNDLDLMMQMNQITSMPENRLLLVGIQGIHLVKPGENLFRISLRYHCRRDVIQRLNKKNDQSVYAGEKLFIPLPDSKM